MRKLGWNRQSLVRVAAALIFAISLAINALAGSTTVINGYNTADISNLHPTLFTPAPFTFTIWGIIYTLVVIYVIRQFVSNKDPASQKTDRLIDSVSSVFILTSVLNACWLLAWQFDIIWLSLMLMVGIIFTLIRITGMLAKTQLSFFDWLTIRLPFSIYFGWITVATIANAAVFLTSVKWDGWGISTQAWTIITVIVVALIGLVVALVQKDWAYLVVLVWAYLGILVRHVSPSGFNSAYPAVIYSLIPLLVILACATLYLLVRWPKGA